MTSGPCGASVAYTHGITLGAVAPRPRTPYHRIPCRFAPVMLRHSPTYRLPRRKPSGFPPCLSPWPHPANVVCGKDKQRAPVSLRTEYLWCTPRRQIKSAAQSKLCSALFPCLLPASLRESGPRRKRRCVHQRVIRLSAIADALYSCCCAYVTRCGATQTDAHNGLWDAEA